mmetsp:Transcript_13398/g.28654  ORF Transcript_13398/g.28654 Transcript_13398/m.28654 type:complete len:86 (+) Transcript_13398:76-333(+)
MTTNPAKVLSLYRAFIREARLMPTANRRDYVIKKVKHEIEQHRSESDPERIGFLVNLAELQLENVVIQRVHLNKLKEQGNFKGPR